MKFNFKKISAIASSVLLTGMTLGVAAAAAFPAPFKAAGVSGTAVVYGLGADPMDATQANSIATYLASQMPSSGDIIGGDSVKLERGSNKFNYGDTLNTHYTSLDYEDFSVVLAKGTYLNDDNNEYKYEQTITPSAEALQFFHDSNFQDDVPTMGFDFDRNDLVLNYTLTFTPTSAEGGAAVSSDEYPKIDNTNLEILGKNFFISDAEYTTNGIQLTLLDAANTATVSQGETKEIVVGGKTYSVEVAFVEDENTATLIVNGERTNAIDEGQTYKLTDGTYIGIKDVAYNSKESSVSQVEFTIGSGKIVLEQGQEVKINDKDVSEFEDSNGYSSVLKAYFTNSTATNIDSLTLEWKVNQETFIAPGTDITMPGLDAVKLSMTGFTMPSEEATMIEDDGDSVRITTQIKDGELQLPILYSNSSISGFAGLGKDSTQVLVTNATEDPTFRLNETENSYFVATWLSGDEAETYAFEIGSITSNSGKNTTKLKNLVSGGTDVELNTAGDTKDVGQITFTLVSANDADGIAVVKASGSSVYGNIITTKEGLTMRLPVKDNSANVSAGLADGIISWNKTGTALITSDPTTWIMNLTEEDRNGNLWTNANPDKSFTITMGLVAGEGTETTSTSLTTTREGKSSDYYVAHVASDLATKVSLYNPSSSSSLNTIEVTYAGSESYADVYFAEAGASSSTTSAGSMVFTDNEDGWKDKNVVLVGGNCVNSATAEVLGISMSDCLNAFTAKTLADSGKYFIGSYADKFSAGKIALVVAGYTKEDTAAAVSYLRANPSKVETTAGSTGVGTTSLTGAYSFVQN